MSLTSYQEGVLFLIGPVLSISAGFLLWSCKSRSTKLAQTFKWSAIFWASYLTTTFHLHVFAKRDCGGNILNGMGTCKIIPQLVGDASGLLLIISFFVAAPAYALILGVVGGIIEWRARHAPSSPDPLLKP